MQTFNDSRGRTWELSVNVNTIKRVKQMADVDLMGLVSDHASVERLIADPCLLVDVLYVLCKPQADAAGVTDVEFGESLGGDALDDATTALLEDFCDFFPARKRSILRTALGKIRAIEQGVLDLAEKIVNDPAMDAEIERALSAEPQPRNDASETTAA